MTVKVLSAKLQQADESWGEEYNGAYLHWCPACKQKHAFFVERPTPAGHKWSFNGNVESPTFHPSMNISWGPLKDGTPGPVKRCHYFVQNGRIIYCGDCTHGYAGKAVELPDIPAGSN